MAVGTPHLALVDLGPDRVPAVAFLNEPVDLRSLFARVYVVELQDDPISFAAVNTGVLGKVVPHLALEHPPPRSHVADVPLDVVAPIARIVPPSVRSHTRLALPMPPPRLLVLE